MTATPEQNNSTRGWVRDRAVDVAGGWGEQVFNPGEFLRRDLSGGEIGPQIDQAIGRGFCRRWARTGKTGILPGRNAYYSENCRGYLEDIGEWPGDGFVGPPSEGGQCAVLYNVRQAGLFYSSNDPNTPIPYNDEVAGNPRLGPITTSRSSGTSQGQPDITINFSSPEFPGGPPVFRGSIVNFRNYPDGNPRNRDGRFIFTPADGSPDDCGNQPADYTPQPTLDPAPPFDPKLPNPFGGPDINIDIDINPDGTINIDLPDFPGNPLDPIDPENPDPGGGDGPPALPPGDQGDPGGSGTTGDGGEEEGEAPPGKVLVGLLLELITIPIGAKEFGPGIYRGPAWIYMGGDAGLDQDFAGSCLAETQFVNAETENATKWRVRANIGYDIKVTPYYREVEE